METLSSATDVKVYMLYVHDDRYTVPTLDTVFVPNDDRAIKIAVERLCASLHHRIAEMWEEDRLVCRIGRQDLNPPGAV